MGPTIQPSGLDITDFSGTAYFFHGAAVKSKGSPSQISYMSWKGKTGFLPLMTLPCI